MFAEEARQFQVSRTRLEKEDEIRSKMHFIILGKSDTDNISFINFMLGVKQPIDREKIIQQKQGEETIYYHENNPYIDYTKINLSDSSNFNSVESIQHMLKGQTLYYFILRAGILEESLKVLAKTLKRHNKLVLFIMIIMKSNENELLKIKQELQGNLGDLYADDNVFLIDTENQEGNDYAKLLSKLPYSIPQSFGFQEDSKSAKKLNKTELKEMLQKFIESKKKQYK